MTPIITLDILLHEERYYYFLQHPKSEKIYQRISAWPGSIWSEAHGGWMISVKGNHVEELIDWIKDYGKVEPDAAYQREQQMKKEKELRPHLLRYEEHLRRQGCGEKMIKTNLSGVRQLLGYYPDRILEEINEQDVIRFNREYILLNKFSESYQKNIIDSIKLFFQVIFGRVMNLSGLDRPIKYPAFTQTLSKEEVKRMLDSSENCKHRTMLSLLYSCGLRPGELLRIELRHLDYKRKVIIIRTHSGGRDRVVPMGSKTAEMLRQYISVYGPIKYLFFGQDPKAEYSYRGLELIFRAAIRRSGIDKEVNLHTIRSSFAVHMLEGGTKLRYIQEILGYGNIRIAEANRAEGRRYPRALKSPFEDF